MMRVLSETHITISALADTIRLPREARDLIGDEANQICFTAASIWKIAIKARVGRVDFAFEPERLLTVDTASPTASSSTLTVAQNAAATPIGITAPTDNLTAAGALVIVAGTLPTDGTVTLGDGSTAVTTGEALTAGQLTGLEFTPTPGISSQGSTFTYSATDGAGNATQGQATLNVGAACAPTIAGTHATTETAEATVSPFTGVTVSDPSSAAGARDSLTITLSGGGGSLTGQGLSGSGNDCALAAASPATLSGELDVLSFTPANPTPGATATTTFTLTATSSAGPSGQPDVATIVTDTAATVAPTVTGGTANQGTTREATVAGVFGGVVVTDLNAGSPSETVTITVGGTGGTLTGGGIAAGGTAGTYTLTGSLSQVNAALGHVAFTPTAGQANSTSTTTFSIVDTSSVGGAATAPDTVPSVVDTDPAVAPTVTGGGVTTTTQNAPVQPFTTAAVADANANSSDRLSIQVQGAGALSGAGLGGGTDGLYVLSGSAGQVTGELRGLTFTPAANEPGTTTTTTFALTDTTTAGPSATNSGTSVVDTVASPATDTVSISPSVSYKNGVFTLTGTASSTAGVRSVEISAVENCGARVDLGAATVNADGTFTFQDRIGANLQGFLQAKVTDNAGGTATSADPLFSLTGGLGRDYGAGRQRRYTADGDGFTADTRFRPDGTKSVTVLGQGQTFASAYDDTFNNAKQADTTFVLDPGFGLDVVNGFRLGGDGHVTLSFKGSDFGTTPQAQLGALLSNAYNAGGSLTITDPTSGDAVQLKGVTKAQLMHNEKDITFR